MFWSGFDIHQCINAYSGSLEFKLKEWI